MLKKKVLVIFFQDIEEQLILQDHYQIHQLDIQIFFYFPPIIGLSYLFLKLTKASKIASATFFLYLDLRFPYFFYIFEF